MMIVEQIMNKNVITLGSEDTIKLALETMKQNRIRHIPITMIINDLKAEGHHLLWPNISGNAR